MAEPRNLQYIKQTDPKLYECLLDIIKNQNTTAQQNNANPSGQPPVPPAINSLRVTANNGFFVIAIQDNNAIYRGINYWVEFSDNQHFTNPQIVCIGGSRNTLMFLGAATLYWRAYSSYATSAPSAAVYFGNQGQPTPVFGGLGPVPPKLPTSQGSGTGQAGQGLQGPGVTPFRSATGVPPTR